MHRSRTILALTALAGTLLAGCSGGLSVLGDEGNVFSLSVGDCFDDETAEGGEVTDVPIVDCAEPHDNEIYHLFDLPDGAYPGDEAVSTAADEGCLAQFEPFVGTAWEDSELRFFTITPTQESWDEGDDREVVCAVYELSLDKVTGTLRGAGR